MPPLARFLGDLSGFDVALIIVLFAVKLFSSFAPFASFAVKLCLFLRGLGELGGEALLPHRLTHRP